MNELLRAFVKHLVILVVLQKRAEDDALRMTSAENDGADNSTLSH